MVMKKSFWIIIILVVVASGAMIALGVMSDDDEVEEDGETADVPVRVVEAEERSQGQRRSYAANIEPWETAHIAGRTGALIEAIHVREGDSVRRGQLVAEMDDSELRQARIDLSTAQRELARTERLVEAGSVAGQQLEQAEDHVEMAESTVEMLGKNTRLVSPIDGVVTQRYFVAGEQFAASAETPAIATVMELDPMLATIDVSERFIGQLEMGMEAEIYLDAYGDELFEGEVVEIMPTVDPQSRTVRVEVRLEDEQGRIRPGMSGRVILDLGAMEGVFAPRRALDRQPGDDQWFTYVVDEDDRVERRYITVGPRSGQDQLVVDGLEAGDRLVVEGQRNISDGSRVQIVE